MAKGFGGGGGRDAAGTMLGIVAFEYADDDRELALLSMLIDLSDLFPPEIKHIDTLKIIHF